MNQREQLIEDAAKAILDANDVQPDDPDGDHGYYAKTWQYAVLDAEAAFAVFEGAGSFLPVASDVQGEPSDAQADAAHIAFHEFCFGPYEHLSERDLGVARLAWKAALRAAAETGGFRVVASRPARPGWDTPSRRRTNKADQIPRTLWDTHRTDGVSDE